jgi:glycosyltransferase involved in cell wall biosynthesis
MQKLISVIVTVDNAQESDLSIPLSSLNNQIGFDFSQLEVILVDNGAYKLRDASVFNLFANLTLKYLKVDQVMTTASAFQHGIDAATGDYVMLMSPNSQLNQSSIFQSFAVRAQEHRDADLISGLLMEQSINEQLQEQYKVGRNDQSIYARWFRRDFLAQNKIQFRDDFGGYANEYVCRLANQLATEDVHIEEVGYVKFTNRQLAGVQNTDTTGVISADWLKMMGTYFLKLQDTNQDLYMNEFARFIVRFYTQLKQIPAMQRTEISELVKPLAGKNAIAWSYTQQFVDQIKQQDQSPQAPWNAEPAQFDAYLNGITSYLQSYGLAVKK